MMYVTPDIRTLEQADTAPAERRVCTRAHKERQKV
jgi:hypothetical protein